MPTKIEEYKQLLWQLEPSSKEDEDDPFEDSSQIQFGTLVLTRWQVYQIVTSNEVLESLSVESTGTLFDLNKNTKPTI